MNNLQKILKYAAEDNYQKFESAVKTELAKRISLRLDDNKKQVAKGLFVK